MSAVVTPTSGASPFTVTCWLDSPTCRCHVHGGALAHHQMNAGAHFFREPGFSASNLVLPDRQREELIMAFGIGYGAADRPCIHVFRRHGRGGNHRAGLVGDRSGKNGGYLSADRCRKDEENKQIS